MGIVNNCLNNGGCGVSHTRIETVYTYKSKNVVKTVVLKHTFAVRKLEGDFVVHGNPGGEWIKSIIFSYAYVLKNIFDNCMLVLLTCALAKMGVVLDPLFTEQSVNMLKGGSPLRSLIVLIPQLLVNIAAVLTFGVFSYYLNWISGDLERWALGDSRVDLLRVTRNARCARKRYLAPCEQPIAILKKEYTPKKLTFSFKEVVREDDRRQVFSCLSRDDDFPYNIKPHIWKNVKKGIKC